MGNGWKMKIFRFVVCFLAVLWLLVHISPNVR